MIQELFGSVRRSLVFKNGVDEGGGGSGGLVDKIINKSSRVGLFTHNQKPSVSSVLPTIRWRKGELIGCGAFGRVYMGMNLDSGELLAVKQVLIAVNSKEKAQDHIRELEEEVKLLKNLSHPNIVRYLGTAREEDTLNILLEFVPGGSISSLLGKFGSFPEAVIIMYTKQLLLGLEYLHRNGIMHRDIKGANILVDNKGCIKLADFGASKQVVELATISGAKSMKGTPYWMAPEVILQTGHSFSADIWSVGCTVIEMATGKPPWSQQYQEVAALFHIGTTKSHPPIPEHLSAEAKDFLLNAYKGAKLEASALNCCRNLPLLSDDPNKSFNPMCQPTDDWLCKYDQSPEPDNEYRRIDSFSVPERRGLIDHQSKPVNTSPSFSERQRKWKEELDQELERTREKMRQAGLGGKILSPNDRTSNRQKERLRFASPSK
ncbi:mitogen-activated protein kinase kinase kinase ANP1-like [Papaver somniferum]|uniref:mitogen-activated protein kinase kinase kinase ANP1-like n=1 Tax=Papaver somniferum TaxID=3469 RepID=UPI000E6F4BB8|nr:mitogen-activated protein kinase kinase kinase ANP1-like [Papaver somniferum]